MNSWLLIVIFIIYFLYKFKCIQIIEFNNYLVINYNLLKFIELHYFVDYNFV